jgi:hypothetical protein
MNNNITIEIKTVYGNESIYITSEHKEQVSSLTGKKTISRDDIKALKALGFNFEVKSQKL